MRSTAYLVCLALAGMSMAHPGGHNEMPNAARLQRHAQQLSEACKRKGRTLANTCPLDPETTEGPYSWSTAPIREDITEGYAGVPFQFTVNVVNSTTCEDIVGAGVQVWHCDAGGIYSHYIAASTNTGTATDDSTFMRGLQYTNSSGIAKFTSIFPGWYQGRTTHIHIRVHFGFTATSDGFSGGTIAHTGQLFFSDSVVTTISKVSPYSSNTATITWLAGDGIYSAQGGTYGLLTLTEMYAGKGFAAGVIGSVTVGVDTVDASTGSSSSGSSGQTPSKSTPTPTKASTPTPTTKASTPAPTPTPTTKATPTPTKASTPAPTPTPTKSTPTPTKATPTPTKASTPAPTPTPTTSSTCSVTIANWGSCLSAPNCCVSGTKCYLRNPWYAQCLQTCKGNCNVISQ